MSDHALLDRDTRQLRDCHLDPGHLLPAQIAAHDERHEAVLASDFAQHAIAVGLGDLDQLADRGQGRLEVAGLLRDHDDAVIVLVVGDRNAKPVVNAAARRHHQPQVDPVLVGQNRIPVLLQDLQLVHSADDRCPEQRLSAGEQRRAPREDLTPLLFAGHGALA